MADVPDHVKLKLFPQILMRLHPQKMRPLPRLLFMPPILIAPEMKASGITLFRMIIYPLFSVPHQLSTDEHSKFKSLMVKNSH